MRCSIPDIAELLPATVLHRLFNHPLWRRSTVQLPYVPGNYYRIFLIEIALNADISLAFLMLNKILRNLS